MISLVLFFRKPGVTIGGRQSWRTPQRGRALPWCRGSGARAWPNQRGGGRACARSRSSHAPVRQRRNSMREEGVEEPGGGGDVDGGRETGRKRSSVSLNWKRE
jgi:hypothetical protein